MFSYLATHSTRAVGAQPPLSTCVSREQLTAEQVAYYVRHHNESPITNIYLNDTRPVDLPFDSLAALKAVEERYSTCAACHLAASRNKVAMFRGNPYSPIMCIGAASSKTDSNFGIPFSGQSGALISQMLIESGIDPDKELAWVHLVGCPPRNSPYQPIREAQIVERAACFGRFYALLQAIRPRIIIAMGMNVADVFLPEKPKPNSWHTLPDPEGKGDDITLGVIRKPVNILKLAMMPKMYPEYAAPMIFFEGLKAKLDRIDDHPKLSRWWFTPLHANLEAPVAGGQHAISV